MKKIILVLILIFFVGNTDASFPSTDNIPPSSITGLNNITYKSTYINWTWSDPKDIDFSKVMIYINGVFKTNISKGKRYYNSTGLIPNMSYKISTHTVDISGNINLTWVNKTSKTAEIISYRTTDKIEMKGEVSQLISPANFSIKKWNGTNFAGFIYDIDSNKGTESLNILNFRDSRTIDKDSLIYITTRIAQKYNIFRDKGPNYSIEYGLDSNLNKPTSPPRGWFYALIGWMGEKYVGVNGKNNKLSKLVLEQNIIDKKTLKAKESWNIGDGYKLILQSIDTHSIPKQAWLILSKNGIKLDDKIISQNETYTYITDVAGETNVPIFVTYADNITSDTVRLKYTWVISTNVILLKSGDTFGIFNVDTEQPLSLKNYGMVSLARGSTINLSGNMKFKVADSTDNDVRFYPFIAITTPGIYDVRGTVSQLTSKSNFSITKWDGGNFDFWYDIDENRSTENLNILKFKDNRTIDKDNLTYTTVRGAQKYNIFRDKGPNYTIEYGLDKNLNKPTFPPRGGYYAFVGWMGEKYIGVNGSNNKLSKLVLEQETKDKKTLQVGEPWNMGDGYMLTVKSIDTNTTKRARIVLNKDGVELEDKVVVQGQVHTYSMKNISGEYNVPIFVTYVESIFSGNGANIIQLKYTWLISTNVTQIKTGEKFGVFRVIQEKPLILKNDVAVFLSRDSTINLFGNMKFKVADSGDNDVRFYPKVEYQI